jgi:hypothetical protein
MERPARPLPLRVHFVTDADRGYTLDQIHAIEGSGMIYSELHERATDADQLSILPAIAIMRTADDLPCVGRPFTPEIVSHLTQGTNVFKCGRVEALTEETQAGNGRPDA